MQFRLTSILHRDSRYLLEKEAHKLDELLHAFGSPLHVMLPRVFRENLSEYHRAFAKAGITYHILYAQKANKSSAILEEVAASGTGVEVSSAPELQSALSHGIPGGQICVSGPQKSPRLLLLALRHRCTISIDSIDELKMLSDVQARMWAAGEAHVLLRIAQDSSSVSRFGLSRDAVFDALAFLRSRSGITLRGFSFHINDYLASSRCAAAICAVEYIREARAAGFSADIIDIGGGYPVGYVDPDMWDSFTDAPQLGLERASFFRDKTFPSFYPYGSRVTGGAFLTEILNMPVENSAGKSLSGVLRDEHIELWIEPGRSLMNQCGMTLMRVNGTKRLVSGENLLLVDANINHLSEQWFQSDFLPEPVLISRASRRPGPFTASVAGNTCLENDLLSWRNIQFESIPQRGDILAYINTAGYQMDTNESAFHRLQIPEKVAFFHEGKEWLWVRDETYVSESTSPHT